MIPNIINFGDLDLQIRINFVVFELLVLFSILKFALIKSRAGSESRPTGLLSNFSLYQGLLFHKTLVLTSPIQISENQE